MDEKGRQTEPQEGFFRDERLFPRDRRIGPRHAVPGVREGMTGRIPLHEEPAAYTSSTRQRAYEAPSGQAEASYREGRPSRDERLFPRERQAGAAAYTAQTTSSTRQRAYEDPSGRAEAGYGGGPPSRDERLFPRERQAGAAAYTAQTTSSTRQRAYEDPSGRAEAGYGGGPPFRDERLFPRERQAGAAAHIAQARRDMGQDVYPQEDFYQDGLQALYEEEAPRAPQPQARSARRDRAQQKADRRAGLEKRMASLSTLILGLAFLGVCVLMVALPRSTVSFIEKRELATFPEFSLESYFAGEYTAGIANFYDDTVPMRDSLKNIGNNFKGLFGLPKSEDSVEFVGNVNKVNPNGGDASAPPADSSQAGAPASSQGAQPPAGGDSQQLAAAAEALSGAAGRYMDGEAPAANPFVQEEADGDLTENGLIVLKQDGHFRALELFGGGSGDSYAQSLNELHSQLGDGVQIWSMPAPLACEFYTPSNFQEFTTSQSDCFDKVAAKLDAGIHSINICGVLSQHVTEPIYCRTDHHWQPLGAYYAAKAFAEMAGVPFSDISTYTPGKVEGFVGSMYGFTGSSDILNDPEDFTYYTPSAPYTSVYYDTYFDFQWDDDDLFSGASGSDAYMIYLGGDEYVIKTDTQVDNGRKLLIVKDSYGNATVPFFTGSFQQIYVLDMRYFQRNLVSFIRDMGITDVLFTMSSYSLVGDAADNLSNLISQNAGEVITDNQPAGGSE